MSKRSILMYNLIVEKPLRRSGVYMWINTEKKLAYVGESSDLNRRICEHIESVFGNQESSNKNLVKAIEMKIPFSEVILYERPKMYNKYNVGEKTPYWWYIDETIYMYTLVENGYQLLNGKEEFKFSSDGTIENYPDTLNDNLQGERNRNFLRKKGKHDELIECCMNLGASREEVEEKICEANDNFKKALEKLQNPKKYQLLKVDEKNYMGQCNKIRNSMLHKEDLEAIGIHKASIDDLINEIGNGKPFAVCKFGDYFEQSVYTILETKMYDIDNNSFSIIDEQNNIEFTVRNKEKDKGICFWAYGRANVIPFRNYLLGDEKDKSPKYLLLPYTNSKIYAKENIPANMEKKKNLNNIDDNPKPIKDFFKDMRNYYNEMNKEIVKNIESIINDSYDDKESRILDYKLMNDFFAYKWKLDENSKKVYDYPEGMFPEVIHKVSYNKAKGTLRNKRNVAFLISDIKYIDGKLNTKRDVQEKSVYRNFSSISDSSLCKTLNGSNSVSVAKILEDSNAKQQFYADLKNAENKKNDEVNMLVAKLEYPYIVCLYDK